MRLASFQRQKVRRAVAIEPTDPLAKTQSTAADNAEILQRLSNLGLDRAGSCPDTLPRITIPCRAHLSTKGASWTTV